MLNFKWMSVVIIYLDGLYLSNLLVHRIQKCRKVTQWCSGYVGNTLPHPEIFAFLFFQWMGQLMALSVEKTHVC